MFGRAFALVQTTDGLMSTVPTSVPSKRAFVGMGFATPATASQLLSPKISTRAARRSLTIMPRPAFAVPGPLHTRRPSPLRCARRVSVSTAPVSTRSAALRACATGEGYSGGAAVASGKVRLSVVAGEAEREDVLALWKSHGWERDDADEAAGTEWVVARDEAGGALGAGRMQRMGVNVEIDRICVEERRQGQGVGKKLVRFLMAVAEPVEGAIYVEATQMELGFFSLLGFEAQGAVYMNKKTGAAQRHMVYSVPICAPSSDCVGLHHTAIRVSDIERSLAWYGSVGFIVAEKFFTPSGERACFVEGLGVRLELVESSTGSGLSGVQDWPGFLVFDVTKGCSDLESFLAHLKKRNGGLLTVSGEPAHQVIGSKLLSVVTVEDPDGLPIEFIRREGHVSSTLLRRVDW